TLLTGAVGALEYYLALLVLEFLGSVGQPGVPVLVFGDGLVQLPGWINPVLGKFDIQIFPNHMKVFYLVFYVSAIHEFDGMVVLADCPCFPRGSLSQDAVKRGGLEYFL